MKTLGYSLFEILYGCCSPSLLSSHLSLLAVGHLRERMTRGGFRPLNGPALADAVTCRIAQCQAVAREVRDVDQGFLELRRERQSRQRPPFKAGDLVMFEQEGRRATLEPKDSSTALM